MSDTRVRTVLIVDDSPEDRDTYKAYLCQDEECAYRFLEAEDADEALELCQREAPDLILLDYVLPTMDGLVFLDRLKGGREHLDAPVVMLTGRGSEDVAVRALKGGASDYLSKSDLTAESITRAARNAIDKAELRRRLDALHAEREGFEKHLMGMVSHDLRNPIHTITFSAATLLRREDLDDRMRQSVVRILASAERASRLVNDILDFTQARLGGGLRIERKPLDLRDFLQIIVDELALSFPARSLVFEGKGHCRGAWDPDRLAQVVTNLVTNAVKYSPEGTPVMVAVGGEADAVVVRVHNEGPPIAPEQLPTIFEPMNRAGARGSQGLGLGLYIVRAIVQAHGGSVDVRSVEGDGTIFTVHLPRVAAEEG